MQYDTDRSSLTYEWVQVTPNSALSAAISRQRCAPSREGGTSQPSRNVRWTRNRGTVVARAQRWPVEGSITCETSVTRSAGNPPRRACSRTVSMSSVSWTQ